MATCRCPVEAHVRPRTHADRGECFSLMERTRQKNGAAALCSKQCSTCSLQANAQVVCATAVPCPYNGRPFHGLIEIRVLRAEQFLSIFVSRNECRHNFRRPYSIANPKKRSRKGPCPYGKVCRIRFLFLLFSIDDFLQFCINNGGISIVEQQFTVQMLRPDFGRRSVVPTCSKFENLQKQKKKRKFYWPIDEKLLFLRLIGVVSIARPPNRLQ